MLNKIKETMRVMLNGEDITDRCEIRESGKSLSVFIKPKVKTILVSKEYVIDAPRYLLTQKNKEDK